MISNKAISDYLSNLGIYHSSQGYKYLMLCLRAILDGEVDRYRVQTVYDYVAMKNGTLPDRVDRSIRHAIRKATTPSTNKEFLLRAADELALAADANAFIFGTAKP